MSDIEECIEKLERKIVDLRKLYERNYHDYLKEYEDLENLVAQARKIEAKLEEQFNCIEPEKLNVILKICELLDTNRRY